MTMPVTIRPLHDKLLVRRKEGAAMMGLIHIPETAKEVPCEGEVLAVGNGRIGADGSTQPMEVKAGDVVLFSKYAGTEVKLEDGLAMMLTADDVIAVVESK